MRPIRLLHISDLHERGPRETDRWRVNLVLGTPWDDNLDFITRDGRPIDFICFTGDIADRGIPDEYAAAQTFITRTAARVSVPLSHVFVVPGNHDIHRDTAKSSWEGFRKLAADEAQAVNIWLAGGRAPNRVDTVLLTQLLSRQKNYLDWINSYNPAFLPQNSAHKTLGYRASFSLDEVPFPIHIIGLDSSFLAGDDHDAQKLIVTDTQVGRLLHCDAGNALPGLRIALYHHPLGWLADMAKVQRLLAANTDIGLRGHLHETQAMLTSDPDRQLLEVAAGCLYSGSSYPNSINVIDLTCDQTGDLTRVDVWVRSWSEGAHWADDNTVYANATDGRFFLDVTRQRKRRGGGPPSSTPPPPGLPPTPPPRVPPPRTAAPSNARARAYLEQVEADAARAGDIRTLRGKGIDKLASMFAAAASELALGFEGPLFGAPDGEAKELAALSAPRGYLDLRRISVTSHNDLRLDTVFKPAVDYIKPFPHPENEELLAEGACNVLVADGMWIVERVAVVARPASSEGYGLVTADANRTIDSDWINSRIDVLIGQRLPGVTGLWRCEGIAPLSAFSFELKVGLEALTAAISSAIYETTVPFAGTRAVGLSDMGAALSCRGSTGAKTIT